MRPPTRMSLGALRLRPSWRPLPLVVQAAQLPASSSVLPHLPADGRVQFSSRRTSQETDSSPSTFFTPSASTPSASSVPPTPSPAAITPLPSASLGHPTSLPGVGTGDEAQRSYRPFKPGSDSESKADLESGGDTSDGIDEIGGLSQCADEDVSVARASNTDLPSPWPIYADKRQVPVHQRKRKNHGSHEVRRQRDYPPLSQCCG